MLSVDLVARAAAVLLGLLHILPSTIGDLDVPCEWHSNSNSHFDLRALTVEKTDAACYFIEDGDIPCTPETEPAYSFVWNFCKPVTSLSIPNVCSDVNAATGAALQYSEEPGKEICHVIGKYDESQDDLYYSLLDSTDPSKGVSMTYPLGDRCASGINRQATIDIECANTHSTILSAQEPTTCSYHLQMKSYYGCPTECPVTDKGLCSSHGICKYDTSLKKPYCYCNTGHYGDDCSSSSAPKSASYDGFSVQLGLLITLLLVAIALVGAVGFMVYKIYLYRKETIGEDYSMLPSMGGEDGIEAVQF